VIIVFCNIKSTTLEFQQWQKVFPSSLKYPDSLGSKVLGSSRLGCYIMLTGK